METLLKIVGVIAVVIIVGLLLALPVMWLWNWIMPDIFNLCTITFWQAYGINLLAGFIFRSGSSK